MLIEAKQADWRRAIAQCRAHETVADFICIAVAVKSPSAELIEAVQDARYGLIHVDTQTRECAWLVRPQRNTRIWPPQRRKVAAAMRGIAYVD